MNFGIRPPGITRTIVNVTFNRIAINGGRVRRRGAWRTGFEVPRGSGIPIGKPTTFVSYLVDSLCGTAELSLLL